MVDKVSGGIVLPPGVRTPETEQPVAEAKAAGTVQPHFIDLLADPRVQVQLYAADHYSAVVSGSLGVPTNDAPLYALSEKDILAFLTAEEGFLTPGGTLSENGSRLRTVMLSTAKYCAELASAGHTNGFEAANRLHAKSIALVSALQAARAQGVTSLEGFSELYGFFHRTCLEAGLQFKGAGFDSTGRPTKSADGTLPPKIAAAEAGLKVQQTNTFQYATAVSEPGRIVYQALKALHPEATQVIQGAQLLDIARVVELELANYGINTQPPLSTAEVLFYLKEMTKPGGPLEKDYFRFVIDNSDALIASGEPQISTRSDGKMSADQQVLSMALRGPNGPWAHDQLWRALWEGEVPNHPGEYARINPDLPDGLGRAAFDLYDKLKVNLATVDPNDTSPVTPFPGGPQDEATVRQRMATVLAVFEVFKDFNEIKRGMETVEANPRYFEAATRVPAPLYGERTPPANLKECQTDQLVLDARAKFTNRVDDPNLSPEARAALAQERLDTLNRTLVAQGSSVAALTPPETGETGLKGHWRYGPNLTADLVIETTHPETGQRLTFMGNRDGRMQFPGTYVNADLGENQATALLRTLKEKLKLDQHDVQLPAHGMTLMQWIEKALTPEHLDLLIEADVNELDPRNTNDSYVVSQVFRINIPYDVMEALMGAMEPSGPWKDAYLVPFEQRVAAMAYADHGAYLVTGALERPPNVLSLAAQR